MDQTFFKFPTFVANQVLSSDDLNEVFDYLDEQERMTRVFLSGTGIVCGLPVSVASDGSSITIGCGCGVTSEGYLIKVDQTTYTLQASFDFTSTDPYQPFSIPAATNTQRLIYELYNTGTDSTSAPVIAPYGVNAQPLQNISLSGFVVVLLYDLNNIPALNCDSESCDGLGITVNVSIKALLINQQYVTQVMAAMGSNATPAVQPFYDAVDLNVNRFNVNAYSICSTGDFFAAYQQSFPLQLLTDMATAFNYIYQLIQPLVSSQYSNDPFSQFVSKYSFLTNGGTLVSNSTYINKLLQLQYYYDHFINLIDGYNELRDACLQLTGYCCPVADTFPRHLLLGLITPDPFSTTTPQALMSDTSTYYTNFMPSVAVSEYATQANQIVSLYNRLVYMYQDFTPPVVTNISSPAAGTQNDTNIVITPTISGPAPLSKKSIPFFYSTDFSTLPAPLLSTWNYELTLMNKSNRNLSYWASPLVTNASYATDPYIYDPLTYDLEKFNFLRVEGIIGKKYSDVVYTLQNLIYQYRLPIDIVVTTTGSCICQASQTGGVTSPIPPIFGNAPAALFADLEVAYKSVVSEIMCRFVFIAEALYSVPASPINSTGNPLWQGFSSATPSKLPFLQGFSIQPQTYGSAYENNYLIYNANNPAAYQNPMGSAGFDFEALVYIVNAIFGGGYRAIWVALGIMSCNCVYIMQYISNLLQLDLGDFASQIGSFDSMYSDMIKMCDGLLVGANEDDYVAPSGDPVKTVSDMSDMQVEDIKILLTELCTFCKQGTLDAIVAEYNSRLTAFSDSLTFNCFSQQHPGLQHRAGVPLGGTLVLVAHYGSDSSQSDQGSLLDGGLRKFKDLVQDGTIIADFFLEKCVACNLPATTVSIGLDTQPPFVYVSPSTYTIQTDSSGNVISTGNVGVITVGPWNKQAVNTMNPNQIAAIASAVAASTAGAAVAAGASAAMAATAGAAASTAVLAGSTSTDVGNAVSSALLTAGANATVAATAGAAAAASVSAASGVATSSAVLMIDGQQIAMGDDYYVCDFSNDFGPTPANFNPARYAPVGTAISRQVPVTYTVNGATASAYITVFKQPQAAFTPTVTDSSKVTATTVTVTFNISASQNYDRTNFNWGDGTSTVVPAGATTVEHTYPLTGTSQGTYNVTQAAMNGSAQSVAVATVNPRAMAVNVPKHD